jgi:hydroxymethylpyrimidine/phosphomethylpyrimidine kinase
MALGGYGTTAITALTIQNSLGVRDVIPVSADAVRRQMEAVLEDIGTDAVKTGMLVDGAIIAAVADTLAAKAPAAPLVVDTVMISKSGAALLDPTAVETLKRRLIPMTAVLTPNIPEAEALLGRSIDDPVQAARDLLALGPKAVLLKGGHATGEDATDILATADGIREFSAPRLPGPAAHGTGCALASAIAAGLAQGLALGDAITRAKTFVHGAIKAALALGSGHPTLDHDWRNGQA